MMTFGKKTALLRKDLGLSQIELTKSLNTFASVISRYERDEMTPLVDTAKKLAELFGSTVGYLLGEIENANPFKDPAMLNRFNDIEKLDPEIKTSTFRGFIQALKIKNIARL